MFLVVFTKRDNNSAQCVPNGCASQYESGTIGPTSSSASSRACAWLQIACNNADRFFPPSYRSNATLSYNMYESQFVLPDRWIMIDYREAEGWLTFIALVSSPFCINWSHAFNWLSTLQQNNEQGLVGAPKMNTLPPFQNKSKNARSPKGVSPYFIRWDENRMINQCVWCGSKEEKSMPLSPAGSHVWSWICLQTTS